MASYSPRAYTRTAAFLRVFLRPYFRIEVLHPERVPPAGGLVMAANHSSYLDSLLLGVFFPRPVRFMMLKSYWDMPVLGWFSALFGSFPVDPEGITRMTFRNSQAVLRGGDVMGIFPEGGRSRDGRLKPGWPGAMLLALRERVPVVPVGLSGTFESMPAGRAFPRRAPVTINIGEPIMAHLAYEYPRDKGMVDELTGVLMAKIERLAEEARR